MLRGLVELTLLEIRIFLREPMGVLGTIVIPVLAFVVFGRAVGRSGPATGAVGEFLRLRLPVLAALLIAIGALASLVTIISIYREGGILKRLRATPLRPQTILSAHVVVKLLSTAATLGLLVLAGRRFYPVDLAIPIGAFLAALSIVTLSVLSLGFVLASVVPTARFAQPITAVLVYPMIAVSGLFVPIEQLHPVLRVVARVVPLSYAVSLLQGVLRGDSWWAHVGDLAALIAIFAACIAISSRVFRWE